MRTIDDEQKKLKKENNDVVSSYPPERKLTAMPTPCANMSMTPLLPSEAWQGWTKYAEDK